MRDGNLCVDIGTDCLKLIIRTFCIKPFSMIIMYGKIIEAQEYIKVIFSDLNMPKTFVNLEQLKWNI